MRDTPKAPARARARAVRSGDSRTVVGVLDVILTSYRNQKSKVLPVFTTGGSIQKRKSPQQKAGGFRVARRYSHGHSVPPVARNFALIPRAPPPRAPAACGARLPTAGARGVSHLEHDETGGTRRMLDPSHAQASPTVYIWINLTIYPHEHATALTCTQQPHTK